MSFEYPYSCPEIDSGVKDLTRALHYAFDTLLDEACPILDGDIKSRFITEQVHNQIDEFSYIFEAVRKTNSDMRDEAEKQITELERRLERAEEDLAEKEDRIAKLEQEIEDLNDELV